MTVAEPKPPTLQERVAARFGTLTATERRVAEYLSAHPQEAAFSSAEELGRATGTSDASVVRTAKALGFDGLPGLKRSLQGHLQSLLTPANRLSNSIESVGNGPEAVLSATLRDHIERLTQAERTLDTDEFRRAVELVGAARETIICGFAGLEGVSEYIATHLVRIGHRARSASDTGYRLADRLLLIGPEDVVVVLAHNRLVRESRVILDHCTEAGIPVILLTDTLGEALRDEVAVVLSAPMSRPGTFTSQATVLILLEALTIAVAAADRERSLDTTDRMNQLREELIGYSRADEGYVTLPKAKRKPQRRK
ncbi:RpiR family transcriptional regulator [Kribbella orskensis]|uniref:RpiR family transcriptional regulator n=1 Tax=Kribbella orskensis TaxID=2512216 RepID=A0ABY2B8M6_9ACTN|nr:MULTISPECIES: MurR/RpiR family transcriptional regulator [Kribbella]TCM38610.1 RpiR family transcriptional regulator [Kribbella sp. VKM Ac-2568]TCN31557.1 RpiR family transcriptional regulator [Kribbella sp. VKM Ac-2500]TCO11902.1 RpiR family transcriptional regulator [Kribbella orskensis]